MIAREGDDPYGAASDFGLGFGGVEEVSGEAEFRADAGAYGGF